MNELYSKIEEWAEINKQLRILKKEEADLRMDICDELLKGKGPGAHKSTVEYFNVTATRKLNYSLDQEGINELFANGDLTQEEEEVIRIRYTLNMKNYKEASCDLSRVDELLTVKDAMPTLEVTT